MAENDVALAALEEQRHEREGRLALARRTQAEVERRLDEKRVELERAEAEAAAALETYETRLRERAVAAQALASAAEAVTTRRREYEAAYDRATDAWTAVVAQRRSLPAAARERLSEPDREPPSVNEAREILAELVDHWFDRELVEAAARSLMGNEIEKLPEHLRALARERRRAIAKRSRDRLRES